MKKLLYNVRPCGNGSKVRILHCREQGSLGIMCRRLSLAGVDGDSHDRQFISPCQFRERLFCGAALGAGINTIPITGFIFIHEAAGVRIIHSLPSGRQNDPAPRRKALTGGKRSQGRLFIFKGGIEDADESAHGQIVDLPLIIAQMRQLHILFCRNDRVVVAYFCVVYEGFAGFDGAFKQMLDKCLIRPCIACFQPVLDGWDDICSDVA